MRILHVLDHSVPVHTAYSHRTLSLLRQQRALGWHTIQLTGPAQGKVETEDRNRDGWHFFRTAPGPGWLPLPLLAGRMAHRLRHAIRLTRPDILHAHPPALNALAALWAGRRSGVPVLVEVHGAGRPALASYVARAADALVADSFALRADLLAHGVAEGRVTVVAPAIDLPRTARDPQLAQRLGLDGGPAIACVGALDQAEGIDLLLAAMEPLLRVHPRLKLLLAGAGPAQERLLEKAAGYGGAVVLAGRLEPEALCELHALADLLVFPRLPTRALAVPRKPLEAMARGALVLASDIGLHRELIDHGHNGILFEAGSVASLAESIQPLLVDRACMQPLRERARAFAAIERSWEAAARAYGPVYKRLIEGVTR
jgi:glycosyltransferase involved in cell wall biosynthesis